MLRVRLKRGTGRIVTEEFMRGLRHEKFLKTLMGLKVYEYYHADKSLPLHSYT